ncbi:hypothetical protein [Paenibacillus amylolyticus]|uniref:hypothetical protein n=1 Tax=Paenibacillus amylolyticus TaxID=1451 RepID=UPI003399278F
MEENGIQDATQEPERKQIFLKSIGGFAINVTAMKLLITLFPEILHKFSISHIGVYELLYQTITVVCHPYFYSVICGLWLMSACVSYFKGNYEVFRRSVFLMGVCFTLFWGLETGAYKDFVWYWTDALS